jgi:molybdopterin molybdotransferase
MSLLPVEEALRRILAKVPEPQGERVGLAEAAGHVLLESIVARHDQPPFPASAMDGYAVRSADVVPGQTLRIVGTSQAGAGFAGQVGPGESVRIFTGAPVPPGADAVIMQEEAHASSDMVSFVKATTPGRSIRPLGNDFVRGQALVPRGTPLRPMQIAVAAAANMGEVIVARRPRVALLATGDELVLPGSPLGVDQIVASNSFGLRPLVAPYSESVEDHGIVGDTLPELRGRIEEIFRTEPDMVITTGGASVGDHDLVQQVLLEAGVEIDFWRINMRPGKPLMFGTRGKTLVFGLPGNPVSALVTAVVFLKPALRQWLGAPPLPPMLLPLAAPTRPNGSRRHFLRAQTVWTETGPQVLPISETDSGHTSSLVHADMLIVQMEDDGGQEAGTLVPVLPVDAF